MLLINNLYKKVSGFNLSDISLNVKSNDYFVLLGPSGSGKSLLLELISGFLLPDSGSINFNRNEISYLSIRNRNIGIMFQDPSLFPHLTVFENIAFGIKDKNKRNELVHEFAQTAEISHLLNRYPQKLSGGEKQRIALARVLASKPSLLLLDEPLSSLDVHLKQDMIVLLKKIHRSGIPIIHVTHDYNEALALATHIAVIENGKIIQQGKPYQIFDAPESSFVASFTGTNNFFLIHKIENNSIFLNSNFALALDKFIQPDAKFIIIHAQFITITKNQDQNPLCFPAQITEILKMKKGWEVNVICNSIHLIIEVEELAEFMTLEAQVYVNIEPTEVSVV